MSEMMHIVVIEWDGMAPPGTYYNRLHKLGLHVRGDPSNKNVLERRQTLDGSVIAQEGAVICASESLAREVAVLAQEHGAKMVQISTIRPEPYQITVEDAMVMAKVELVLGKRGKPTSDKVRWVVTCLEEMKTYLTSEEMTEAINCPRCGGLKIKARIGELHSYSVPSSGSNFERWLRHRFANGGGFEVPQEWGDEPPTVDDLTIDASNQELQVIELIRSSPKLLLALEKLPPGIALSVLDGVLRARGYALKATRRDARVATAVYLVERHVQGAETMLIENPSQADVLDASILLGTIMTANAYIASR